MTTSSTSSTSTTTTYTVLDLNGLVLGRGCDLAEAAHIILTDDGREYEIRPAADGDGFYLWSRQQVANRGWTKPVVFSLESDRAAAEAEIFAAVLAARWPQHPEAIPDAEYDTMTADLAAELEAE